MRTRRWEGGGVGIGRVVKVKVGGVVGVVGVERRRAFIVFDILMANS